MTRNYRVNGPDAEVYGPAMLAFFKSINFENFKAILEEYGLVELRDEWYPQQIWMDVLNRIASTEDLVSIGIKIMETAVMPDHLLALPFQEFMQHLDDYYRANNRGKDIGGFKCQIVGDKHILMVDTTPYPDEFIYGIYYALIRRSLKGRQFTIAFDDETVRRGNGGSETRVHITWS